MTANSHKADLGRVWLSVAPHPFSLERVTHQVQAGASLADMMALAQPDIVLRSFAHVTVNGHYVDRVHWGRVYPKAGTTVSMRMVPQGGGGGKNPLRTILTIAVLAASPVIAASLAGAVGATGTILGVSTSGLIASGVNIVGRLAINAIAPPARPKANLGRREGPVYFVQGAQNRVEHFARIPKVLGRHRSVPPLGAMPYTETHGGDQYLRMLFVWGYGPLEISDLKIGETPLSSFEGVEIETRQGYSDDAPLTLYSNAVLQNDMQIVLRQSEGAVTRVSEAEAEELSVDITFPRGVFRFGGANNKRTSTVELEIRYAPLGSEDWSTGAENLRSIGAQTITLPAAPAAAVVNGVSVLAQRYDRVMLDPASGVVSVISGEVLRDASSDAAPVAPVVPAGLVALARVLRRSDESGIISGARIFDDRMQTVEGVTFENETDFAVTPAAGAGCVDVAAGGLTYRALVVTAKQSTALRRAVSFKVPKGQYQVKVRRLTVDATDDNTFNECSWSALRTVRATRPVRMQGLAMTALRIKATDQLNGVIDRFNGVVTALVPDWNGSAWVVQPTSNPASIYRHVLQGVGNGRPLADTRLDLATIQAWHERCRINGDRYDAIIDHDTSVRDILHEVAAAGRASPALIDGRWSVVQDIEQTVPVQHFTPRNTLNFEAQKAFDEQPQALRVRFINRDKGWAPDERLVYTDGYDETNASVYETLELPGVTGSDQAWRHGRYHLATALLRPETYQFTVDVEHLVCTRGDMVRLTHDVPMFGLASARVKAVTLDGGGLVSALTLDADLTQDAGKQYSLRCRLSDGGSVVMAVHTVAGTSNTVQLEVPLSVDSAPAAGDLAMFGESGQDSVALIVRSIEPFGDLAARVTCVDAAPEIYQADQGVIPPFKSNISLGDHERAPPAPHIAGIQSGEESLIRHTDGSLTTRIVVTLHPPAFSQALTLSVMIRGEGETTFVPANILDQNPTQVSIVGIDEGQRYDIVLRYLASGNRVSLPRLISGYQVTGTTALPSDVTGFGISVVGDHAHLRWQAVGDADLSHYVVRHSPDVADAAWSNAIDQVASLPFDATSAVVPALPGTYLIKAVDVGGRYSAVAATAASPIVAVAGNLVIDVDESAAFAGEKTDIARIDGALRLECVGSLDDESDIDDVDNIDLGEDGLRPSGVYAFSHVHDLGAVYTSRITAVMDAHGLDTSTSLDQWQDVDEAESWDAEVDPARWSVVLQISTTQVDPSIEAAWSNWQTLAIGDYSARAFRFRVVLTGSGMTITPVVSALGLRIDMPDRYESGVVTALPATGGTQNFASPFRARPTVHITPHDMQSGDYWQIASVDAYGFAVQFFDSTDTGVVRSFDYTAKGYGRAV